MKFLQVVIAEEDSTPSGAPIRNEANFNGLSMLTRNGSGKQIELRTDKHVSTRPSARIVAPVLAEDIAGLLEYCLRERPCFVLFEGVHLYQAIEALARTIPELPIILDMHNIESSLWWRQRNARFRGVLRAFSTFFSFGKHQANREIELSAVRLAHQIWVCSEEDRLEALRHFGEGLFAVIPNPIPEWTYGAQPPPRSRSAEVLFVGHLDYRPNRLAVRSLCRDIMPKVVNLVPEASLHICGRGPREALVNYVNAHGHKLTANAPDLASVYAGAALTAIPLPEGGGTRLKVLEAMAVGCLVIASPKAVEGLGLLPDVHFCQAESIADFAQLIAAALTSPDESQRISQGARRFVLTHYGREARLIALQVALQSAGLSKGPGTEP